MPFSRKEEVETIKRALWITAPLGIALLLLTILVWPLCLGHLFKQHVLAQAKGPGDLSRPQLYLHNVSPYLHQASGFVIPPDLPRQYSGAILLFDG